MVAKWRAGIFDWGSIGDLLLDKELRQATDHLAHGVLKDFIYDILSLFGIGDLPKFVERQEKERILEGVIGSCDTI